MSEWLLHTRTQQDSAVSEWLLHTRTLESCCVRKAVTHENPAMCLPHGRHPCVSDWLILLCQTVWFCRVSHGSALLDWLVLRCPQRSGSPDSNLLSHILHLPEARWVQSVSLVLLRPQRSAYHRNSNRIFVFLSLLHCYPYPHPYHNSYTITISQ